MYTHYRILNVCECYIYMFPRVFRPYVYLRFIIAIESLALITSLFIHLFFSYVIILCATIVCVFFSTKFHMYISIYEKFNWCQIFLHRWHVSHVPCASNTPPGWLVVHLVDWPHIVWRVHCARFFAFLEIKPWAAFNQNVGFICSVRHYTGLWLWAYDKLRFFEFN